jgi:hypothetical protein
MICLSEEVKTENNLNLNDERDLSVSQDESTSEELIADQDYKNQDNDITKPNSLKNKKPLKKGK